MAADYTVKQGNTLPILTDTLTYNDGTPVPLSGATVTFVMRALSSTQPVTLTGTTAVVSPTAGTVSFSPTVADTANSGQYMGNWVVVFSSGDVMTFPTVGYLSISVEENLTTPGGQQLVSLPDVKDYLSIDANDRVHDAKLVRFIHAVTPLIESITGPIIPKVFEEWHSGGQSFIQLRRRPSRGYGTSPVLDLIGCSEFIGPTEYTLKVIMDPAHGTTYSCQLDSNTATVVRRTTGGGMCAFAGGMDGVHVWYRAGQATVPPNVYEGALEAIRVNYTTTQQVGRGRLTPTDDYDVGPALGYFLPRRVHELLAPNRRAPSVA